MGSTFRLGRPLQEEIATHSCILAQKIPWTEEPDGVMGSESDMTEHSPAAILFILKKIIMSYQLYSYTLFPNDLQIKKLANFIVCNFLLFFFIHYCDIFNFFNFCQIKENKGFKKE